VKVLDGFETVSVNIHILFIIKKIVIIKGLSKMNLKVEDFESVW